ncbi:hypothetical protein DFH07DRAFT_968322 [Mycena maculata]|uniref:Uncharacterized protein n=1 Tax=Mycena maculata TaxID=230809 RepID=A0AAD7I2R7_9AGAR|nr:hypothetical protein DFH07DRAFT_968322 [Mycena maculata]
MASHPNEPTFSADSADNHVAPEIPDNASHSFTELETNYALDFLKNDPSQYLSGNGFKAKAFTEISAALRKWFPMRPIRSKDTIGNCLRYVIIVPPLKAFTLIFGQVKGIFEEYEFVRGKSGVGWDDGEKKATAETNFIKQFTTEYGDKYAKCFKKPCPCYNHLAELFGGNKATGEHVLHLAKSKKKVKLSPSSTSASVSASTSTSVAVSTSPLKRTHHQPLENLQNDIMNIESDSAPNQPLSPKPHDDELRPPPAKHRHLSETTGNDDETENSDLSRTKAGVRDRDRSASASSSSGGCHASRNTETGSEIVCGLKLIGQGMSVAIITKANTSHVDTIIDAFTADPSLLLNDPDGKYYALFLDALSANEMRARVFIKTPNRIQRIALLKHVLTDDKHAKWPSLKFTNFCVLVPLTKVEPELIYILPIKSHREVRSVG